MSRRYTTLVVAAVSLIVLTSVALLVPVPYVTMSPGPAFDTLGSPRITNGKPLLTFGDDVKTYPTTGSLDFTTVSVTRADSHLSIVDALKSYADKDVAVVPKSLVYPDNESAKQSSAESAAQLDSSKDASKVAALRAAGYDVPGRPVIAGVIKGGAAEGKLEAGDVVTTVDGSKVSTPDAVVKAVGSVKPGDTVRLGVERKGAARTVPVVTRADPQDPDVPRIGISIGTKFSFPIQVDNNVGRAIGGPSAGTMFALAIYDRLTPGQLTGGRTVAGTGEITADGVVGPIGGVRQKMAGAAKAKATIFLVPAANCAEALDGDDDGLKLVKITKLDDAISSLEALAKDPQAKVPSCS
ncbi:PDZ/DHR/GLGF domain-containing protein [Aeromicrobium chenweiae]|uniref:endopeptidase La n=1 Tax=Aeromicrobium chenweiae TaxID=2079793 RepID=A0A2S0WS73_9ACTN|nr:PDZ/DHR/GLGF domain-containing protein [Aeromicrobium chenweiae]TGN34565.1 PDZ domain-containing protein [Aeromicrobium chenweiae]